MKPFKIILLLSAAVSLLAPSAACAENACALISSRANPYLEAMKGFKEAFKGKVEEIVLETAPDASEKILEKLKQPTCDVVIAMGSNALKFIKLRPPGKPVVFAMTLSPSASGISNQDMTGVYLEPSPQAAVSFIHKTVPGATKLGVLYSASEKGDYLDMAKKAAGAAGLSIVAINTPTQPDTIRAAQALALQCDLIWMIPDFITSSQQAFEALLSNSLKSNIPIFALSQKNVMEGALATIASDYMDNGRQAAAMALRIAGGTSPSNIPPEFAKKSGAVINLKTAKRIGLTIPANVISEAIEVYR